MKNLFSITIRLTLLALMERDWRVTIKKPFGVRRQSEATAALWFFH
jgi:hypothetical protein